MISEQDNLKMFALQKLAQLHTRGANVPLATITMPTPPIDNDVGPGDYFGETRYIQSTSSSSIDTYIHIYTQIHIY